MKYILILWLGLITIIFHNCNTSIDNKSVNRTERTDSLPNVDPGNIGATGASGGGNQTMWLAALDERVKTAVPIVSVGTFEAYIMRSNCICELLIYGLKKKGSGITIVDLSGTVEVTSTTSLSLDGRGKLHTLSRAELWLGKTVLGESVKELKVVNQFLNTYYKAQKVSIDGTKEAALAGLFLCALEGNIDNITLREAPVSCLFDNRETVDFFSMEIHLPGFLSWGDLSLASALSGTNITFINPVSMSGKILSADRLKEYQVEYDNIRRICGKKGKTSFI
jgi:hypothetical protein